MKKVLPAIFFVLIVTIFWELSVFFFDIPEYLLPSPFAVMKNLFGNFPNLIIHIKITLIEATIGFIFGVIFGFILAVLFVHSETLEKGIYPYAIALKSVPIVAIAPLLIVWFGNGLLPKIIVAGIIAFFPVVVNTVKGMRNIDLEAFDLFNSLSASAYQIFFKLRIPKCLPSFFASLRMSSTLAVIGAIVGEFAGSDRGIGYFILISSHRLDTINMFVGIFLSSALGIIFFYVIVFLEKIVIPWERYIIKDFSVQ